ncbi:MAG: FlgD immunoglobulin-like domain containing protein, partial [bacterium]
WQDASVLHLIDEKNGELLHAAKIYFKTVKQWIYLFVDPYKFSPENKLSLAIGFFNGKDKSQNRVKVTPFPGAGIGGTINNSEPHLIFETGVHMDSLRLPSNYFLFSIRFSESYSNGSGREIIWPYLNGSSGVAKIILNSGFPSLENNFDSGALKPGEIRRKDLTFLTSSADSNKKFQGQINVYSNDPARPVIILPLSVDTRETEFPTDYILAPVYPNPFNPTTTIQFQLPGDAQVTLKMYNVLGQCVREIFSGHLRVGTHHFIWDGRENNGRAVASGVYFAVLNAFGQQKVVLEEA